MKLKFHIFFSLILSLLLMNFFGLYFGILFLASSIFIDLDHPLAYFLENKKPIFSYKKLLKWLKKRRPFYIFHNVYFLLFSTLLFLNFEKLLPIYTGILFHYFLDIFTEIKRRRLRRWFC